RILSRRGLWPLFLRKKILSIEYHRYSSTGKSIQPEKAPLWSFFVFIVVNYPRMNSGAWWFVSLR
ncbi:hypothetical protein K7D79_08145, partial [Lactobacillus johnsonii]|nr:hypothetical protein [Lactobacillus johnsonii]